MKLHTIDSIFTKRLLRIPDYQRGYAWNNNQINDFWEDVNYLDPEGAHYTGVVTLEKAKKEDYRNWGIDKWIVDKEKYVPFYIVDGQQRLTTAVILIQTIIITITKNNDKNKKLNGQSIEKIKSKYIVREADDKLRKSFLFGYEIDNPSDEFLRKDIFNEKIPTNNNIETLYTRNLLNAKEIFLEKLNSMDGDEIIVLYKKLTQNLKFNLYQIDDEIDVCVTFEAMNNRGKSLSTLELLKNRLIYLSTLFKDKNGKPHEGREVLRNAINETWKTIYQYLGKNPNQPLDDDEFLKNHWIMYFTYSRNRGDDYIRYLLDDKFTVQNVNHPWAEHVALDITEVHDYVVNLQESIEPWFYIHNPYYPNLPKYIGRQNKKWIDKLTRLNYGAFRPLLLASYVSRQKIECINMLLRSAEKYNFVLFYLSKKKNVTGDSDFYGDARELLKGETSIDDLIKKINEMSDALFDENYLQTHIAEKYAEYKDGFYKWHGLQYFLYEYEYWLNENGKGGKQKIQWDEYKQHTNYFVTREHIYPQNDTDPYWQKQFNKYEDDEKYILKHSLGNLLPLLRGKNSALQNYSFPHKKNNGNGIGYFNGSAAENEINAEEEWNAQKILDRGIKLLDFMEKNWDISFGDRDSKVDVLQLGFVE